MGPVLVFGHRNPDNDSVCSAVAYAHLRNLTDAENVYVPARLGPVPPETAWVFERFGLDLPDEIAHVYTRVQDVMTENPASVTVGATMLEAGRLMREHGVRALPVLDDDGRAVGLVNESILAALYLDETRVRGFEGLPVTVGRIARALDGRLLEGDAATALSGGVLIGAMEPDTMLGYIRPGDTLILGDRRRTQPLALNAGVACLVVTGGAAPDAEVIALARERGAAVITTEHDTYGAARLVNLGHSVESLMDADVLSVDPDTLLSEVAEDLVDSVHREAIVVDSHGMLTGVLTRTNLARGLRRRVVLVDHNELSQSAPGVEFAEVLAIVDHHRVGDVQTTAPIMFINLPVGSTATIVAERYRELGVETPVPMAGILLAALLTDTVLLKSPTATALDRTVAERLAARVGVEYTAFGLEMFKARSAGRAFSAEEAVSSDLKEYRVGDATIAIGQVETVDTALVMDHLEGIRTAMAALERLRGYDLLILMVTDVMREGSEIVASGRTRLAERALGIDLADGTAWMPGVLSRKKQVAAPMLQAAGR
jgi:manganese-dependent inorganic pyrophosphatase